MDKYKKFFGQTWCATGDVRGVDEKIVTAIRRVTGLGDSEAVVLFAYADGWAIREQVFVIVTSLRVIVGLNYSKVKQALFSNIEQIERKRTNIHIHAKGDDFDLFVAPFWPVPELVDRAFQAANQVWLNQKQAGEAALPIRNPSAMKSTDAQPAYAPAVQGTHAAASKRGMSRLMKVVLGALALIVGMGILGAIVGPQDQEKKDPATASPSTVTQPGATHTDSRGRPVSPSVTNDAELLIHRCGPPDSDSSTENDSPRPPIPSRLITYKKARLMFAYTPGGGAKVGAEPPYKWESIGIKDTKTNKAIAVGQLKQTIADRLPCFLGD